MATLDLANNATGTPAAYDEARANDDNFTLLTVSASGTTNGSDTTNSNWRGANVYVNITTLTGTSPTLTVNVQGKDPVTGTYYTIFASAALATTGFTVYEIYPGVGAASNGITATSSNVLPRTFRVQGVTGGTITTIAATVTASMVV